MAGYGKMFLTVGLASNYPSLLSIRSSLTNLPRYMSMTNRVRERLGFPPKPKRPLTAYFRFVDKNREQIKIDEPNLKMIEHLRILSQKWATCDPKEKEELQKAYNLEMVSYSKQMMMYEQSITPEQKRMFKEELNKEKGRKEKLILKKKCNELGKPKKPPTAFFQYLQENKYSPTKFDKGVKWVLICAEKWRDMSDEEKSKYKMESQKLMEQYKEDLRTWEERMVRSGHIDVVRNRGLLDMKYRTPNAE